MLEFPEEVSVAVATRYPNITKLSNFQLMNARHEAAKSQLSSKDLTFTTELEERAIAQHQLALKEWDLILEDISAAKDVLQYILFMVLRFVSSLLPCQGPRYPFRCHTPPPSSNWYLRWLLCFPDRWKTRKGR